MATYCIVAARPKNNSNNLKSQFYLYEKRADTGKWRSLGWRPVNGVVDLMVVGNTVLTGEVSNGSLSLGEPVEVELRIAKNGSNFKISGMSDTEPT